MTAPLWMRAVDCPLLQPAGEAEPGALRLVQRLLEIGLLPQGSDELAKAMLEEVGGVIRADQVGVWEALPNWQMRWQQGRRGMKTTLEAGLRVLLNEVLDREAGVAQPAAGGQPSLAAACLSFVDRPNRVILATRAEGFRREELEFVVAAGHYLGMALERGKAFDETREKEERLAALVQIAKLMAQERETPALLETIAGQAVQLLGCERASIFLWDQNRHELVGRPALGMPNNELRISDKTGVVGQTVQTGQVQKVDQVQADPTWNPAVDKASGFQTRNLLCVPMPDGSGQRIGAIEVINKKGPFSATDVETLQALAAQTAAVLASVREREALVRSHNELDSQARLAARIIGASTSMVALRGTVERVARTELPVLILGESGTGKDVVARAIHFSSLREKHPFIPVNCAALTETLLESELFGHEKGSFTGADAMRQGKFEAANGGTLFLDEIGEMSAGGQAKLLRVLEEKVVYRVGGTQGIPVDTRVLAATNRKLADQVRAGKFREDLFYRLTVVALDLPALRDRREDILVLAEHFLTQFCKDAGRKPLKFSAESKKRLEQHDWPGNVRELRNLLERVAYLCQGDKVEGDDLAIIQRVGKDEAAKFAGLPLAEATDAFQKEHIQAILKRCGGNSTDAAKMLGLHRPNLYRKMRALGMNPKD